MNGEYTCILPNGIEVQMIGSDDDGWNIIVIATGVTRINTDALINVWYEIYEDNNAIKLEMAKGRREAKITGFASQDEAWESITFVQDYLE